MRDIAVWKDRSVVVLGLARSGVAVAKLLHQLGAHVVANDVKPRSNCPEAIELEKLQIPVICGEHPDGLIDAGVDLLVKNPGIPYRAKPVQQALAKGIPVWTEVEIAFRLSEAPIIGITGSNGKTTTSTLLGKMLTAGGVDAVIAGNIGQALTEVVPFLTAQEWLVAELSSFQLKGTERLQPKIAALLNLVPAHLDYHETMADYIDAKEQIFRNQTGDDVAVLNADALLCQQIGDRVKSQVCWFSRTQEVRWGVCIKEGRILFCQPGQPDRFILAARDVALRGDFNLENALAATALALACACPVEAIRHALRTFHGVEHRLEYVATIQRVSYFNDSKATNVQATIKALESFAEPIVWIAGGLDRGVDFRGLVPSLQKRVRAVVAYGEVKHILRERAKEAGIAASHLVADIAEAVQVAYQLARPGEVVLLSPACASWDLYASFAERGSIFKQAVHSLPIEEA
jgi:UDP-N-acetylmuramoylalanine--D-glutamate ligase